MGHPAAVLAKPYSRGIHKLNDTADPVAVIRNALSAQFDQNAVVVMAGPATNLVRLLVEKRFLEATNDERPFRYRPVRAFQEVSRSLVRELVERFEPNGPNTPLTPA